MIRKVCILDYGSGNVASVRNSFQRLSIETLVSNEVKDIRDASHLVLPGVGAFKSSMEKINAKLPLSVIYSQISHGKPFLGICVGMQALAEKGFEFGVYPGLALLPGSEVIELPTEVSKPHVGWNSIETQRQHPILNNIQDGADFYFVHSYFVSKIENADKIAVCDYGVKFPAVIAKENLIGVQFHPEKSQSNGNKLLENFVELIK
jgi:imidazole glycerol-phosphate synthase subunit HisH